MFLVVLTGVIGLAALYLYHVNRAMKIVPDEVHRLSPNRWTANEMKAAYQESIDSPIDVSKVLPPKQSRRYVIVGGSGLVGNWIVSHMLARGEDPTALRVVDLQEPPTQGVGFIKANITDELAVTTAFEAPWPAAVAKLPLTVFHTAAVIRPSERLKTFLPMCQKVNVDGTKNILNAAKNAGASCFVSTSSGSITLRRPSFWIAPWKKVPDNLVQIMKDDAKVPQEHDDFFGNYAVSKAEAERFVCSADDPASNFRTGCIRPANGVYGIGSDSSNTFTGQYLRSGGGPTWVRKIIHSQVNAENVSIAHLLYEQRLIEQSQPNSKLPNIGGQAFVVTDPNPPVAFNDIYMLMEAYAKTPVSFTTVEPIAMFLLSYLIEAYAVVQYSYLPWLLPAIPKDLYQLQPTLFNISDIFCIADDSRARKAPEQGGLGYEPPFTTIQGISKQLLEWNRAAEKNRAPVKEKIGPLSVSEKGVDVNFVSPEQKL
ncbi:uncharacterized protein PFLUO_LOCUS1583 [Penicillium psychrofluorescens]|uniref:uncharacterized protein n=1 Tax=Penicillium psychrofluorescens TaxID=3158075 RepID=UPI003CCDB8F1